MRYTDFDIFWLPMILIDLKKILCYNYLKGKEIIAIKDFFDGWHVSR